MIRDNDSKYTIAFDTVFEFQDILIIPTLIQATNTNSYSERWVRTVKEECLGHLLNLNEAYLRRVLIELIGYYNSNRPHQSLDQQFSIPRVEPATIGKVERRQILGAIINDYFSVLDETAVCLALFDFKLNTDPAILNDVN